MPFLPGDIVFPEPATQNLRLRHYSTTMPSRSESRISHGCHRFSSISRRWRVLREAALAQARLGHGALGIALQQTACKLQPRHPLPFINGPFPVSISFSNLKGLTLLRAVLIRCTLRVLNVPNSARVPRPAIPSPSREYSQELES
jgi:hypothetical protein